MPLRRLALLPPPLARVWRAQTHTLGAAMTPRTQRILDGVVRGERAALAQAITLGARRARGEPVRLVPNPRTAVESTNAGFFRQGQLMLSRVLEHQQERQRGGHGSSASFRIGISGPPGVGKSTFIEAFGRRVIEKNHRLAVLVCS
jgi:LAO/AO transport system kinase